MRGVKARNWHKSTPSEYLRNIPLRAARAELAEGIAERR